VRPVVLLLVAVALAGCGGSSTSAKTLYESGDWKVVVDGSKATAQHRVEGEWQPDTSGAVHVAILGPRVNSAGPPVPQVAAELTAPTPLVESGLWVDGVELLEKGGSLSPRRGTIYGAPAEPLAKGTHTAVAFARTASRGTAVAWTFRVV
jgi:hypothetical protein